jgi:two-component system sensor histidine kinase/response regulator
MLTQWGARTTCSDGGEQALSRLNSAREDNQPYDVVLTDMHMPDMGGFKLVEQIRRNPGLRFIAILS